MQRGVEGRIAPRAGAAERGARGLLGRKAQLRLSVREEQGGADAALC